jgi:hypothetical protein
MAKKLSIEDKTKELRYEGFGFSDKAINLLHSININKNKLITMSLKDFDKVYSSLKYKGWLLEIANVLNLNGYPTLLEQFNDSCDFKKEYRALGYSNEMDFGIIVYDIIMKKSITIAQIQEMTFEDFNKYRGLGYNKIKLLKEQLESYGLTTKIVLGPTPEEEKAAREKLYKETKEKFYTLLIEKTNLDPKNNPYDKWLLSEYKKGNKDITLASLESKIRQLEEL